MKIVGIYVWVYLLCIHKVVVHVMYIYALIRVYLSPD